MRTAVVAYDVDFLRRRIAARLQSHGYEVHEGNDHDALLQLCSKAKPTLVVMNAALRPCGALASIPALRASEGAPNKIIVVTPERDLAIARDLERVGADAVILNGYGNDALDNKLRLLKLA
jgi:DNA-binding NarL/FixJ family response regulator